MKALTRQEEQILLVIYHLGDTAYLVNIREKLKEMTGKALDVGTIYIPLRRLADRGLLHSTMGESTSARGGKAIKYYRITKEGAAALEDIRGIQDKLWKGVVL
ncbi:PadR family transcriptional regulator [bacterium]|nr:PadR family transcriptional regulator [bacterium]